MESKSRPRIAYLDNIRWTVIAMVVLIHACVTYSRLGSWYYTEDAAIGTAQMLAFYAYQLFSQAFFMGLLFFVAATFIPAAYDRKGFGGFVRDRLVRLGAPTLIYMLLLHPLTIIIREASLGQALTWRDIGQWWLSYVGSGTFLSESGPLWFALALLVFSVGYALCRLVLGLIHSGGRHTLPPTPLSPRAVHAGAGALIAVLALGSFLVRLVRPMGTSWYNMQLCFFFQYIALFCVGLWASRSDLLQRIPRRAGRTWLWLAFAIGVPAWLLLLGLGGALTGNEGLYGGGWHWQAAAYAAWEAFFCVSISVGLLTWYREHANVRGRLTGLLSETSFGIYCFHAPVLVGVTVAMRTLALLPLAKALLAAAAAWSLSLAIAWLVRRVPGVGKLFQ
jgi:glucans biosynthesis protein C